MKFAGIDVGAERHMAAMVGEEGEVLCRSSLFGEDAPGYMHLFELLGPPEGCLHPLQCRLGAVPDATPGAAAPNLIIFLCSRPVLEKVRSAQ